MMLVIIFKRRMDKEKEVVLDVQRYLKSIKSLSNSKKTWVVLDSDSKLIDKSNVVADVEFDDKNMIHVDFNGASEFKNVRGFNKIRYLIAVDLLVNELIEHKKLVVATDTFSPNTKYVLASLEHIYLFDKITLSVLTIGDQRSGAGRRVIKFDSTSDNKPIGLHTSFKESPKFMEYVVGTLMEYSDVQNPTYVFCENTDELSKLFTTWKMVNDV